MHGFGTYKARNFQVSCLLCLFVCLCLCFLTRMLLDQIFYSASKFSCYAFWQFPSQPEIVVTSTFNSTASVE
jgi:hypothetical protein